MGNALCVLALTCLAGLGTLPGQTINLVPTSASPIATPVDTLGYTQGVAVGDFNDDGKLDVALSTNGSPSRNQAVVILLGNGDGTFKPGVPYATGKTSQMVVAAPFSKRTYPNGHPILDLAIPNFGGGDITILLGNRDTPGTFFPGPSATAGGSPNSIAVGDFNDDGSLDIAVSLGNSTNLAVLIGNGDGSFQAPQIINLGEGLKPGWVGAASFTNRLSQKQHAVIDLVTAVSGAWLLLPGHVDMLGNPDGIFDAPKRISTGIVGPAPGSPPVGAAAIADLNGDGSMDLVFPDTNSGTVLVLLGIGDGTFQAPPPYPVGTMPNAVAIADFHGDGKLDLAIDDHAAGPKNLAVLRGNGNGTFEPALFFNAGPAPLLLAAGDFNNDHKPDLVAANQVFSQTNISDAVGTILLNTATVSPTPLHFVPVTPCRVADTRNPNGSLGGPTIASGVTRTFPIPSSSCGIPSSAAAYSLNIAVVPHGPLGYLAAWPAGQTQPLVATLSSLDGRVKSNAAIVPAGSNGAIDIFVTDAADVILDINGYFSAAEPSALAFYPVAPCRVADTRGPTGPLGGPRLAAPATRNFPILSSTCGVPATAQAYSLNLTVVPQESLAYLTAWPEGETQPLVATLNALTGTVTANAAIVPAGVNGAISVFATDPTDLVIDINGYFAPPGTGGLSLYTVPPCRVKDTRDAAGPQPAAGIAFDVNVGTSGCGAPGTAGAYVFNVTAVPQGPLGYLTMWPKGQTLPLVATLNAIDGAITSNMALVPAVNGSISVFVTDSTYVIIDMSAYFAQ